MIWTVAVAVWFTVATGVYLAMSRDIVRSLVGLAMLGSAINLLLLAAGRFDSVLPAVVAVGGRALTGSANPLPQALVLTAIVIGFALLCFALVLTQQIVMRLKVDDALKLNLAEPPAPDPVKPPIAMDAPYPPGGWAAVAGQADGHAAQTQPAR